MLIERNAINDWTSVSESKAKGKLVLQNLMFSKCDYWMIDIQKRKGKKLVQVLQRRAHRVKIFVVFSDWGGTTVNEVWGRKRIHVLDRGSCDLAGGERFRGSKVIRESAEEIEKVLFSHESRILTPGGGTISPGGAGPPASPSSGHYHPPTHSPPLVKVSDILPTSSVLKILWFFTNSLLSKHVFNTSFREKDSRWKIVFFVSIVKLAFHTIFIVRIILLLRIIVRQNWRKEKEF